VLSILGILGTYPALAVEDQNMIDIFPCQATLDPRKHLLAAEEHAALDHRRSGDIGIEHFIHALAPA
jgi:hypothetical protein